MRSGACRNPGTKWVKNICFGCGPLPVTVTTRIITFLIGNPYNPSFTTVTVRGPYPIYVHFFLMKGTCF